MRNEPNYNTIPVGQLGIIALPGCEELANKIDNYLIKWRFQRNSEHKNTLAFAGYEKQTYIVDIDFPRFGTGEGKAALKQTVRGYDIFILCDVFNYGVTYKMYGMNVPMSPDAHFANIKRAISAIEGKAKRISVIMPMLYEGRQHKRSSRESLDCAMMLQELHSMGVENIITFDAHDPRVMNAIPLCGFESVSPAYQMIKAMVRNVKDLNLDKDNLMIISPDEGGMSRCIYYSTVLGVDLGMFYKRRDYSRIVDGRNPIIAHEFLGDNVAGKDVIIVDDMISSGESMIEVATKLKKELGANRIYIFSSFGLFCNGLDGFDKAYKEGVIYRVFTTNVVYRRPELKTKEWYIEVDLSKYISYLIDTLNHDTSLSELLDPEAKINKLLKDNNLR